VTATSGPGLSLKKRDDRPGGDDRAAARGNRPAAGGPSTGLPTKTEQSDLLFALYGRHGEAPLPVLAASSPGDCFYAVYEACRIAVRYMTPVILLADGYLANGAEPWRVPDVASLPPFTVQFATKPNFQQNGDVRFLPYRRDPETLARPWARPGTPGLEHRIGGLEKDTKPATSRTIRPTISAW